MNDVLDRAIYQYSLVTADKQTALASNVITSGTLGSIGGEYVTQLEQRVAERIGREHAIGVASATAGLEVTLRALGAGPGRQVIVPALGWVSVGAAAAASGASVSVAPVAQGLAPCWEQIEPLLRAETCAVVLAHMRGMPALGTVRIAAELAERGISLIEDCAQAWGVTVAGRPGGGHATLAVLSTDTRITTPKPVWRGNARMNEITAALALPQLQYLDEVTAQLRPLQQRIAELLREAPGVTAVIPDDDGVAATNGSHAGAWFVTAEQAEHRAARLYRAGVRCWSPSTGDLHTAAAWPIQPALPGLDGHLHRYLDIQIPILDATDHEPFCHLVRQALEARP
jgi:dTDP-4-amino-4,6-dideoxygalactose transaminase